MLCLVFLLLVFGLLESFPRAAQIPGRQIVDELGQFLGGLIDVVIVQLARHPPDQEIEAGQDPAVEDVVAAIAGCRAAVLGRVQVVKFINVPLLNWVIELLINDTAK